MQFISTILQSFIMQIISTILLCNYKVPVITTKKNFTFCRGKSRENFPNFFQDFPGLKNKIPGLSRTFQDRKKSRTFQDFSRMWQPWFGLLAKNLEFVESQLNLKKGSVSVLRNGVVTHFQPLLVFVSGWNWLSYCWGHAVRPVLIRVIRLQSLAEVQSFFLAFPDQLPSFGAGSQT